MSQLRSINARTLFPHRVNEPRIGPDNRLPCRVCGGVVRRPRLTICSQECQAVIQRCTSPTSQRWAVEKRDKGVCALCGLDTKKLHMAYKLGACRTVVSFLDEIGFSGRGHDLWQMDHISPVVEGGGLTTDLDYIRQMVRDGRAGEVGLENLRTLCIPCHKLETAELAKRRAAARRDDKATLFAGEACT